MYVIAVYDDSYFDSDGKEVKVLLEKVTCQYIRKLKFYKKQYQERYPGKKIVIKKRYRDCWQEIDI